MLLFDKNITFITKMDKTIEQENKDIINKKDLVAWLKEQNPNMSLRKLEELVDIFFSEIATALVCGDRVELRGLGSMVVKKRDSKIARNPKTNQKIEVDSKGSLHFKPSKDLIRRINLCANDN